MNYESFLIKYSEIGLKGKNRYKFEDALVSRIRESLKEFEGTFNVYKEQERIYVDSKKDFSDVYDKVIDKLKKVFGVFTICPINKTEFTSDYKELSKYVIDFVRNVYGENPTFTFKVKTRRVNKSFDMHSDDISAELGHDILETFKNTKVDVHSPDVRIFVEIRNHINIYSEKIPGPGGLPVGTSGKAMLLLSGGIDSPVAGFMIAKRGVVINAIYFHAPPYTSDRAKQKVIDLAKIVSNYSGHIKLHIINFTDIQLAIYDKCPHDELTIIMRRYMMRIAENIAAKEDCLALITGESIGQVASQTVESLVNTNEVCNLPVFRPLIGFDKEEIVEVAKKIGTFETSILPYEDCCTIFVAKHPVTKPKLTHIYRSEERLKDVIDDLLIKAIDTQEEIIC
ncbi:MAG: tRNA 4-thiouridine(8) synthase ThiI [Lachnospiraceae bacterium]|nr:tRNA 4-thiouridine(8) synthase ThiI [Lachnospiraceae bacterium]